MLSSTYIDINIKFCDFGSSILAHNIFYLNGQKAKIELAWQSFQRKYAGEVDRHRDHCQALRNAGTKAKDLPKGPGRSRLKSPVTEDDYQETDGPISSVLDVEELEKDCQKYTEQLVIKNFHRGEVIFADFNLTRSGSIFAAWDGSCVNTPEDFNLLETIQTRETLAQSTESFTEELLFEGPESLSSPASSPLSSPPSSRPSSSQPSTLLPNSTVPLSSFVRKPAANILKIPVEGVLTTTNHLESFNCVLKRKEITAWLHSGHCLRFDTLIFVLITEIIPNVYQKIRARKEYNDWCRERFSKVTGGTGDIIEMEKAWQDKKKCGERGRDKVGEALLIQKGLPEDKPPKCDPQDIPGPDLVSLQFIAKDMTTLSDDLDVEEDCGEDENDIKDAAEPVICCGYCGYCDVNWSKNNQKIVARYIAIN
ncbi:hypothetical protein K435DRAFT_791966 [Dendrothele bispora CBS 962.96]|uniref:Uncharacterized protein n=1 Tax=Dendrothele bispora (strain CBS 962.96) TaxID=1314807 RepID=A0A4S8MKB4_DENBC|nr:hypothetical protein K435DRAFT_791966 [Dendrothele bispora CBS 962.96]